MQIPDSDELEVAATFRRSLSEADFKGIQDLATTVIDFPTMAAAIGKLSRAGRVAVPGEFQYFTRASLRPLTRSCGPRWTKLRSAGLKHGGLFVRLIFWFPISFGLQRTLRRDSASSAPPHATVLVHAPPAARDFRTLLHEGRSVCAQNNNVAICVYRRRTCTTQRERDYFICLSSTCVRSLERGLHLTCVATCDLAITDGATCEAD